MYHLSHSQNKVELDKILAYQELKRETLGRYISFSEAIAMWMSDQLKDSYNLSDFDTPEHYH